MEDAGVDRVRHDALSLLGLDSEGSREIDESARPHHP